ncbi:hypothetical protein [Desulfotomaculum copahuensis]|uniref:Uncharacterized protein n=1 Tax=Desulfotomaculum copahuensis TaxID=1838280 RepID=A0A1B7LG57_9FIRM|nr:hypothetical protein [Desulfotomaculum copahuensis]OAT83722.1 hypothetical protein A6M21_07750 [Desulfotomaculum copahuensis]
MKIVFHSDAERRAWELFLEAHRKWYKNHGDELTDMVDFMGEVEDKAVVDLARNMVINPEKIQTDNGIMLDELFSDEEADALVGKKVMDAVNDEKASVVGFGGGYIEVEYEDGCLDRINKSEFQEAFINDLR